MRFSEHNHHHESFKKSNADVTIFPVIILIVQVHQHRAPEDLRSIQKINSVPLDVDLALALIPLIPSCAHTGNLSLCRGGPRCPPLS
jgi:hypothetical protein